MCLSFMREGGGGVQSDKRKVFSNQLSVRKLYTSQFFGFNGVRHLRLFTFIKMVFTFVFVG